MTCRRLQVILDEPGAAISSSHVFSANIATLL
jgi:hypothetical protein